MINIVFDAICLRQKSKMEHNKYQSKISQSIQQQSSNCRPTEIRKANHKNWKTHKWRNFQWFLQTPITNFQTLKNAFLKSNKSVFEIWCDVLNFLLHKSKFHYFVCLLHYFLSRFSCRLYNQKIIIRNTIFCSEFFHSLCTELWNAQ